MIKKRVSSIHAGVKSSLAYFFASMVSTGISYIITPIYTRLLTSSEYGIVSLFMTWLQIFGIIAMFCFSYGVFNNGMTDYPERRDEYSFSLLILSNIVTIIFSIIIIITYPIIKQYIQLDLNLIVFMCVLFLFQPAYNFWRSRQRYELKYKAITLCTIAIAILSPLFAIISIYLFGENNRVYSRIFGAEIPLLAVYIIFYIYIGYNSKWKIKKEFWKDALLFNLPLIPHYLSTHLLSSSDKIMISYLIDSKSNAYYSVAHSVASVAIIIWTSVNGSLIPYTYEKCKNKEYDKINKVTIPILSIFALCSCVVILCAPEVVRIMATTEYLEAIYVIPPIVGGVFFQVQYYIYANIVYYYKKPVFVMLGSLTAVVMNLILNYYFINKYGYIAAGYTTLICYIIQAVVDYFAMRKIVGKTVYNMKMIFTISIFVILVSLFSNFLYKGFVMRYIILVFLALLLLHNRQKIIDSINIKRN